MRRVHLSEPKQRILGGPLARNSFLNPVASHRKVGIGVAGLPRITCETDFTFDRGALYATMGCQ
jgi:hypothetical protein